MKSLVSNVARISIHSIPPCPPQNKCKKVSFSP
jgi:hypothetical protein